MSNEGFKKKYMKYKIVLNFFSIIIILIVGGALYKQFDFQNMTFEKPVLAVIYVIVVIFGIGFMIKKSKKN
mgnify:CR=1 FL=1